MRKAVTRAPAGDRKGRGLARQGGGSGVTRLTRVGLAVLVLGQALSESAAGGPPPVIDRGVHDKVREGGSRVVVELYISGGVKPEGELPGPSAVRAQREAIAHAQATVLSRLGGARFVLVRQYTTAPFLVLEIGAEALALLETMGDVVVRVRLDVTVAPNTGRDGG